MRILSGLMLAIGALGLSGCVATTRVTQEPAVASQDDVKGSIFPVPELYNEANDSEGYGRPIEPAGLSVVQKRHLYARRIMVECVKAAPAFETGLQRSALQPASKLSSGAAAYADRTFKVAASSTPNRCDVRALGGDLDQFAEDMRIAFQAADQLLDWRRDGTTWRGALMVRGQRYQLIAKAVNLDAGKVMVATLAKG
jgi:hypothetical protein